MTGSKREIQSGGALVREPCDLQETGQPVGKRCREQQAEATKLDKAIAKNLKELGYGG